MCVCACGCFQFDHIATCKSQRWQIKGHKNREKFICPAKNLDMIRILLTREINEATVAGQTCWLIFSIFIKQISTGFITKMAFSTCYDYVRAIKIAKVIKS